MPGIESKLPDGWERSETTSGIPYYIDHETESTSWDHPEMVKLLQEIASLNNIKYAAYRTAMKLRAIQKKTQMFLLELPIIIATLQEQDIRDGYTEKALTASDVHRIITAIFINQNGDRKGFIDIPIATDLTFNWILNTFDLNRTGFVRTISLKVGLSLMCAAKIQDKYKYIFRQLCNSKGWMDRKRLKAFLQESLQIPRNIYESSVFSGTSVEPAIRNFFERTGAVMDQLNLEEFLDWMVAEPQTVVWLPTLHRVAVSETVKHEAKCNICKMYPIVGFRYRCLKCFNFDLCQECFWLGRTNKSHKVSHPTQEYCLAPSQKEDFKDFAKVMRNKVSKKKNAKDPSKGRYISIANEDAAASSDEEYSVDAPPAASNANTHDQLGSFAAKLADHDVKKPRDESPRSINNRSPEAMTDLDVSLPLHSSADLPSSLDIQQKDELENLISNLEDDNRALRGEIDHIHQLQLQNLSLDSHQSAEEAEQLRQRKERLLAREEVLESHNQQLEIQLSRLRSLLHQNPSGVKTRKRAALSPTIAYQPTPLPATTRLDGLYLYKQTSQPLLDNQPSMTVSHDRIAGYSQTDDITSSVRGYTPYTGHRKPGYTPHYSNSVIGYSTANNHNKIPGHTRNQEVKGHASPDGNRIPRHTPNYSNQEGYTSPDGNRIPRHTPNYSNQEGYTSPDGNRIPRHTPNYSNQEGYTSPDGNRIPRHPQPTDPNSMTGKVPPTRGFTTSPSQGYVTQGSNVVKGYSPLQKKTTQDNVPSTTDDDIQRQYSESGVGGYSQLPNYSGVGGNTSSPFVHLSSNGTVHQEHGGNSPKQTQIQSIVERMASSFPITQAESDISMEMHSDLFQAATMVGQAMQSLVTAVSRQGVPSSAFPE